MIMLTNPEDQELWLAQLRAFTDNNIWEYINLDRIEVKDDLLKKLKILKVSDFDLNANSYAQLLTTH